MNSDQENFDELLKLLALKKYEQPPPRYFSELPSRIWSRIEREPAELSFWERFLPNFGINPALAYSFGLVACGTLVFGIGYSLSTESTQLVSQPTLEEGWQVDPRLAQEGPMLNLSNFQPAETSTDPVMDPEALPSLFNGLKLRVEPTSYPVSQ